MVGCVETSLSEPSKAADTVIKAVLKGAFHRLIEAAGAALFALSLSKEQPCTHTPTRPHTHTHALTHKHTLRHIHTTEGSTGKSAQYLRPHKNLIYYSHRHPPSLLTCFLSVFGCFKTLSLPFSYLLLTQRIEVDKMF